MIDARQWAKLEGLLFTAKMLVEGLYAGQHASPRRGPGLEFHDYRPYVPGDDPAAVDWKLYGRTDRYYLKRYLRYTDLHAYLLVDASASMNFAGLDRRGRPMASPQTPTKFDYARQLAAAIAFLTVRQGDRVGLGVFDKALHTHLPPGGSFAHLRRVVHALEDSSTGTGPGDVGAALAQAHAVMKRRGLVVLICDLLDEPAGLMEGLGRLRHDRFDIAVLQVLSPQELGLETMGRLRLQLVDAESRDQVATSVPEVARRYDDLIGRHVERVRRGCVGRGIDHELLRTDEPVVEALRRYVSRRSTTR